MLVFQLNSTTCWLIKVCLLRSSCVFLGDFDRVHFRWLPDWRLGEGL